MITLNFLPVADLYIIKDMQGNKITQTSIKAIAEDFFSQGYIVVSTNMALTSN